MRLSNFTSWFFLKYNRNLLLSSGRPMFWINLDSNTLGSAALTPQEETKIKKIEDATEAARNKLRNHHIYGVSLKFFRDFFGFYRKFPGLVPGPDSKPRNSRNREKNLRDSPATKIPRDSKSQHFGTRIPHSLETFPVSRVSMGRWSRLVPRSNLLFLSRIVFGL